MAMVVLVLVIACGNVSMLLAARNAARQREFSLRTALGSGQLRLLRQLTAESAVLVGAGTVLGWLFAVGATRAVAASSMVDVTLAPDRRVLWFTLALSAMATLVFGLAPLRAVTRASIGTVLKSSAANVTTDRRTLRTGRIVVAAQIALCLVLLVGAGLLVRTLQNLNTADLGMQAEGLLVFGVAPPQSARGVENVARFYRSLLERLRALPGVESATVMSNRVGSGWSHNTTVLVDGKPPRANSSSPVRWNAVGADYFRVFRTPVVIGRDFTDADSASSARVAIVNQTFVDRYLPGQHPLGHQVSLGSADSYSIVGVAADSRYTGVREPARPMAYFPYTQVASQGAMHVELRASVDPIRLLPDVRRVVQEFGPDLPLLQPMTQRGQFQASYADERLFSRLATAFGVLAAALVGIGLYGALAFRVSRRTREIGVRMALGAAPRQVSAIVMREIAFVGLAGVMLGLPLALVTANVLRSMLFGVGTGDPVAFAAALAAVVIIAVVAGLVPARRAWRVNPVVALRQE